MITAIDHIVLTSTDVDKTIAFYCDVLGMELQSFSPPDGSAPRRVAGSREDEVARTEL